MKKFLCMILAVMTLTTITCTQAFAANSNAAGDGTSKATTTAEYDYQRIINAGNFTYAGGLVSTESSNYNRLDEKLVAIKTLDEQMFTTGCRESAESTGIVGTHKETRINTYGKEQTYDVIDDSVKWTLKNGVLTIYGNGTTYDFSYPGYHLSPFSFNPHIKTVVIEDGVTVGGALFDFMPNVTSISYPEGEHNHYAFYFYSTTDIDSLTVDGYKVPLENFIQKGPIGSAASQKNETLFEGDDIVTMNAVKAVSTGKVTTTDTSTKTETTPSNSSNEDDDPIGEKTVSSWAETIVAYAIEENLVPESGLGTDWTKAITRAQFCAIATQTFETCTGVTIEVNASFTDTNDTNVLKMASIGVVGGYGGGVFGPNDLITREQAATLLYRLREAMHNAIAEKYDVEYTDDGFYLNHELAFTDSPSGWAETGIKYCNYFGIMNGYSSTQFGGKDNLSIEQSIIAVWRARVYPDSLVNI